MLNKVKQNVMSRLGAWILSTALVLSCLAVVPASASAEEHALTRGEFASLLVTAAHIDGDQEAADLLVEKGILKGYSDGDLRLSQPITKVEAIALIGRSLGLIDDMKAPEGVQAPLDENHWGYHLYAWLNRQGALPADDATVDPLQHINKQQAEDLLKSVFESDPEAIDIVEQSQAAALKQQEDQVGMRTKGSAEIEIVPRAGSIELPTGNLDMNMSFTQEFILPNRLHQVSTMQMSMPGAAGDEADADSSAGQAMDITTEMYWVEGDMVQKMPDPVTGEPSWYRMPQEMIPDLDSILQMAQQSQAIPPGFEKYFHYQLLGTKQIDGEEVYEIAFYGRIDDFSAFIDTLNEQFGNVLPMSIDDESASDLFKSMSYWGIEYIGKDDLLPRSMQFSTIVLFPDEMMGEALPIEAMLMNMTIDEMSLDKEMKIEIPEEALDAPVLDLTPPEAIEEPDTKESQAPEEPEEAQAENEEEELSEEPADGDDGENDSEGADE